MKANSDKSHLLLSCSKRSATLIDGSSFESNRKELLLGIVVDRKLKFDDQVNNICKILYQKLNILPCLTPFVNINKRGIIMIAFIESQFG